METFIEKNTKSRIPKVELINILQSTIPSELNIYNQAHLELDTPLISINRTLDKTMQEIGVSFSLKGEISGQLICLMDTSRGKTPFDEDKLFKSLFIESINILTGQLVTNMENDFDVHTNITDPQFFDRNSRLELEKNRDQTVLSASFKFTTVHDEFDCKIIFEINHR